MTAVEGAGSIPFTQQQSAIGVVWLALRHFVSITTSLSVLLPAVWPLCDGTAPTMAAGVWYFVLLSVMANLGVLAYHFLIPPHPKFTYSTSRRLTIRIHLLAGSAELVLTLAAFALGGNAMLGYMAAATALLFHVPTACLLTPTVFGSRAVMWPGYSICIALHAFCAVMLFRNPASPEWTVATFLVLNVYAWVRVFFYAFTLIGLFPASRYSAAILMAEAAILPVVFGSEIPFLLVAACLVYIGLYRIVFSQSEFDNVVEERSIEGVYSEGIEYLWGGLGDRYAPAAATAFEKLAGDERVLSSTTLVAALQSSNVSNKAVARFLNQRQDVTGGVTFDDFKAHFWSAHHFRAAIRRYLFTEIERSEREKADFVFSLLDLDHNGLLAELEMNELFSAWGLSWKDRALNPQLSGGLFLQGIDRETFFTSYANVWEFLFHEVVEAPRTNHMYRVMRALHRWGRRIRARKFLHNLLLKQVGRDEQFASVEDADVRIRESLHMIMQDFCESSVVCRDADTTFRNRNVWFVLHGQLLVVGEHRATTYQPGDWVHVEESAGDVKFQRKPGSWLLRFDQTVFDGFADRNAGSLLFAHSSAWTTAIVRESVS